MNDYLEHYGIKGMKWGVRRTAEQLGHKIKKAVSGNSNGVRPDSSNLTNGEGGAVHSPDICGDEWQSQMRFTTVSIA